MADQTNTDTPPKRGKNIPVARSTMATAALAYGIVLAAIIVAILQVNARADEGVRSTHAATNCAAKQDALGQIRNRLSHEEIAERQGFKLNIPPYLEPRLPIITKDDPCKGILQKKQLEIQDLIQQIQTGQTPTDLTPLESSTTTTTVKRVTTTTHKKPKSVTTHKAPPSTDGHSTTPSTEKPTAPPCTVPMQLCGLVTVP